MECNGAMLKGGFFFSYLCFVLTYKKLGQYNDRCSDILNIIEHCNLELSRLED